MTPPVTLQISLAPSDHRLAAEILPHQIRTWRGQVAEILLTIDLHRSRGRFADGWAGGRDAILALANSIAGARVVAVDDGPEAMAAVSREFFGGRPIPRKDHRGGPYYSYFFALHAATHPRVLHCDADMMFGGGSPTWVAEACALLDENPDVLLTAPLPGPPAPDGRLRELPGRRLARPEFAYEFPDVSTRVFLLDRNRWRDRLGALRPGLAAPRGFILALLEGNPPRQLPERLLAAELERRHLRRIDFLGQAPGMWSLHPPYRGADFFAKLPALVRRVEAGDMPPEQLGFHDVCDQLVDWSEGRQRLAERRWWRRLREKK
ncbi:glycosyltransferase family 2 protein [Opitutus sp. GAS368]|uniref:glycosyltransferase family 2 protein n=1 Tax=Opitutus sp. GAS368 TaxID=1882749 RepID=UPI00087D21EE|nr:glycosyltransferase family 2 protein [Opitutus sp. GAS368]SDS64021.1 hypothetical protein SAMN05444173_3508 [Opitutus sp. GAS368]